jgi:tetratricopeptide (TPR) repeat protein
VAAGAGLPATLRRGGANASFDRSVQHFYQALALRKLGQADSAAAIFREVAAAGEAAAKVGPGASDASAEARSAPSPRTRMAAALYLAGLGHTGLGDLARARGEFESALAAAPDNLGAKLELAGN